MNKKAILLAIFILMVAAQLFVPAKMIFDQEVVRAEGQEFWFETQPIDPNDPFRGKYVALHFQLNQITVPADEEWATTEDIYLTLSKHPETGFAVIDSYSKLPPESEGNYLKAQVGGSYLTMDSTMRQLNINYPFSRFYMEETQAPRAEKAYASTQRDENQVSYAVVRIYEGQASLVNVMIGDRPLAEVAKEYQEQ